MKSNEESAISNINAARTQGAQSSSIGNKQYTNNYIDRQHNLPVVGLCSFALRAVSCSSLIGCISPTFCSQVVQPPEGSVRIRGWEEGEMPSDISPPSLCILGTALIVALIPTMCLFPQIPGSTTYPQLLCSNIVSPGHPWSPRDSSSFQPLLPTYPVAL